MSKAETTNSAHHSFRFSQAGILALLFSAGAMVEAAQLSSLKNYDVWVHLRTGLWILVNKTWPTTGLFSQASNLPWRDFSWVADAAMAVAYRALGLGALPILWMMYRVAVAVATFSVAGGCRGKFWLAVGLSAFAQYLLWDLGPVGAGNSVLFFALELAVLLACRKTGKFHNAFWLPPLLALWANCDLGFIYGIALLFLFLVARTAQKVVMRAADEVAPGSPFKTAMAAVGGCVVATLLSPYGYHSYGGAFAIQARPANRYLFDYSAMTFHRPQDYVLLLLTMAAFWSLGLRRSRDLFVWMIFIVCTALCFSAQNANWLGILVAIAVIGNQFPGDEAALEEPSRARQKWIVLPVAASLLVVLLCYGLIVPRDRTVLAARVVQTFPARACDYIRQHHLQAPIFNTYTWGSFLTWYLPEYPVAIDARRTFYPTELETEYFRVMGVFAPYQDFRPLMQARTLLLYKSNAVGDALRGTAGFRVVYEDNISLVLLHEDETAARRQ